MLFPDTEFLHTRVQNLSWLYLHPAKKKEPTENSVDPHCFSGDYNRYHIEREKSVQDQCKLFIRINFFVFLIAFNVFSDSID